MHCERLYVSRTAVKFSSVWFTWCKGCLKAEHTNSAADLDWPGRVDPVTRRLYWSRASASPLHFVLIGGSETRTVSARLVPNTSTRTVAGPTIWNSLPDNVICPVSVNLPTAFKNISVPGLVPWHYHWSLVNYSPPQVDLEVILLLGPI